MIHIITGLLHKAVLFKVTAVLLSLATAAGIFQLSSVFQVHALNVHTEIKASPPGLVRIIDSTGDAPAGIADTGDDSDTEPPGEPGTDEPDTPSGDNGDTPPTSSGDSTTTQATPPGQDKKAAAGGGGGGAAKPKVVNPKSNRPTVLSINTPIEFGTVFRGEELEGEFTIYIDSETTLDPPPGTPSTTWVKYRVYLGVTDNLTPYLTLVKKFDGDTITDNVSPDSTSLIFALLDTRLSDTSDTWLVQLDLSSGHPDYSALITGGDYESDIHIDVIDWE